jgi:hypothetical protein
MVDAKMSEKIREIPVVVNNQLSLKGPESTYTSMSTNTTKLTRIKAIVCKKSSDRNMLELGLLN